MAIDISSLTKLITEFRQISAKDEITPESLGYLIQQVTDLLANASSDEEIELANQTVRFIRSLPYPLSGIAQGTADRNNILLSSTYNRYDMGAPTSIADNITIKQATTERAGAMRAQHVSDLYDCKSAIKTLQSQASTFEMEIRDLTDAVDNNTSKVSTLQNVATSLQQKAHGLISLEVVYKHLQISGYARLAAEGYVPYLFRRSKRKTRVTDLVGKVQRQDMHKGWHMMGRDNMLKVENGVVSFNTKYRYQLTKDSVPDVYSPKAYALVNPDIEHHRIPWGHSPIFYDNYDDSSPRLIVLHYAIAFGPRRGNARIQVRPCDMVSNLAEFKVMFFHESGNLPIVEFIKP